jgi:hypothetical protein
VQLSAPIYRLKRKARQLARDANIPLHTALNRVASEEGFGSWSLLAAKAAGRSPAEKLFPLLSAGDLLLVGARPGQGKTLLSLELAAEAMRAGRQSFFFTLEYTERQARECLPSVGTVREGIGQLFAVDCSEEICATYIIERLADAAPGTLVVIDYLQLLDQRRDNPALMVQVRALRTFAQQRKLILVFISQIDRAYDATNKPCPDLADVRMPNPLDLSLFSKTCFLNEGHMVFGTA